MQATERNFQIGDRIIAEGTIDNVHLKGRTGTVVCYGHRGNVGIEFDEKFPGGHDCSGNGKNGHCRYADIRDEISLIDDVEFEESEELNLFLSEFIN